MFHFDVHTSRHSAEVFAYEQEQTVVEL